MPDKRSYCVVCANFRTEAEGKKVVGKLFVCRKCTGAVLVLHLLTNPLKWLCPQCMGVPGSNCIYCDLRIMIRKASSVK